MPQNWAKKEIKDYYKSLENVDIDSINEEYIAELENCETIEKMQNIILKYVL